MRGLHDHLPGFGPGATEVEDVADVADADGEDVADVTDVADGVASAADPGTPTPAPATAASTADPAWPVEVVRSARRKRSVGAQLVGGVLRITIPSWMSRAEEQRWVEDMRARFLRRASAERIDLPERARSLARRFGLDRPSEIRWVDDMTTRWGSCTPSTRTIRISSRIAAFPDWVIDYVIVHELAHLHVGGHGDDFWRLVARYPRTERAIGYLMAKSGED